jgi:hypothetical protein
MMLRPQFTKEFKANILSAAFPSSTVESDDSTGTNRYAKYLKDYNEIFVKAHLHCRLKNFKPITEEKIKCWFDVLLNTGMNPKEGPIKTFRYKVFSATPIFLCSYVQE